MRDVIQLSLWGAPSAGRLSCGSSVPPLSLHWGSTFLGQLPASSGIIVPTHSWEHGGGRGQTRNLGLYIQSQSFLRTALQSEAFPTLLFFLPLLSKVLGLPRALKAILPAPALSSSLHRVLFPNKSLACLILPWREDLKWHKLYNVSHLI